jgi:protocatechuate 3,4-dioxygenase, beta subunit
MELTRRAALAQIAAGSALIGTTASAQGSSLAITPLQDVGPFYPLRRPSDSDADLTRIRGRQGRAAGEVVEVTGRVLNARGEAVSGAVLEIWQANAAGRYAHASDPNVATPIDPEFQGFARLVADARGGWRFVTVRPGAYPVGSGRLRTPHIHFDISGRTDRLTTQMYFPGERLNATDRLLQAVRDPAHLIARADGTSADGALRLHWDIVLATG